MVIPAAVRKRYHITPGSRVEVMDTGQEIVLVPVPKDAFRASRGMLKGYSVREFLRWRRQERQREHGRLR
jgi:AbrB family looped-hinge helix DNA binding protein